jgi:hypothetical protein
MSYTLNAIDRNVTVSTLDHMLASLNKRYDAAVTQKRKDGIKGKIDQVKAVRAMLLSDTEGF